MAVAQLLVFLKTTMTSGKSNSWFIRTATLSDLDAVKHIADSHRKALGFVLRSSLAESIQRGELLVAEGNGRVVGFVEYHLRRDKQVTLYHIAIASDEYRQGIGQALFYSLRKESESNGGTRILLKCPVDLEANQFYQSLGFDLVDIQNGRKRPLNVWAFQLLRGGR
jgi:N-acetylglutamate synthase-like GNAT family acetyltransferase